MSEPVKYSAEWVRQQAQGKTRLMHHDCGGCGYWTSYIFDGDNVYFDPGCHCSSYGPAPFEPRSYQDIADWLAMGIIYLTPEAPSGRHLLVMWISL